MYHIQSINTNLPKANLPMKCFTFLRLMLLEDEEILQPMAVTKAAVINESSPEGIFNHK